MWRANGLICLQAAPGPWRLSKKPEDGYININSDDHYALATVVWLMDADEIAGINSPDCEANAHLIAAAPELLEALKGLMAHMPDNADNIWQTAAEAIAKAKGGAA
jgi:hypothetical protein